MKNHPNKTNYWKRLRESITGLYGKSFNKSYYPQIQRRIEELEKATEDYELLNDKLINKNLELKESEERYRLLFENVWDVVFLYDSEFSIKSVSPSVERILGYRPEELTGRNFLDINILAPESLNTSISNATRLLAGEKIPSAEYEFIAKDGTRKTGEVSGSLVLRGDEIIGVISIGRDITERKKAEELINHQSGELARTNMEFRAAMEELEASNEELIRSNDQLTESEERYRSLFEGVPIGLYRATRNGKILEVNRALTAMLGYPDRQTLLAVNARDLYADPGDRDRWLSLFERKNIVRNYEIQFRTYDGSIIWVRNNGRVVREENKRILCYEGSLEDITELKKMEKELRKTEQKLHDIFQGSPIPAFIINTSHQVIHWNRALEEMSGIKSEEVMDTSQHWRAFYNEARPCMADLLLDGNPAAIASWYNGKCRKSDLLENTYEATDFFPNLGEGGRWLRFTVAVIRGASGDPLGALETLEDITKRKQAEEALRDSEEKYHSIYENSFDAIMLTVPDGRILGANPEACRILGRSEEEICRLGRSGILDTSDPTLARALEERARLGCYRAQLTFIRSDGTRLPCEVTSSIFRNKDNNQRTSMIIRDISERMLAEVTIRRSNRALHVLGECNSIVARSMSEQELLDEICLAVVKIGGYRLVWVGYAEHDERKTLRPVAYAGFEVGYLERANITWADNERGRGPGGTVIRTGEPVVCRNVQTDGTFAPWRDDALKREYESLIALPLKTNGRTFGAIGIYAAEVDAFDDDERKLLIELSETMAFGIVAQRRNVERIEYERNLRESEEKYKTLVNNIPDIIYSLDRSGKITSINKEGFSVYGYRYEELMNEPFPDFIHPDDKERVSGSFIEAVETRREYTKGLQFRIIDKKGEVHWLELHSHMRFDSQGKFYQEEGVLRDITERKLADEKLLASLHEKEALLKEVHHRVKNNMQVIMSLINLNLRKITSDELINCYKDIQSRVRSMALVHEKLYKSGKFSSIELSGYINTLAEELCREYYHITPFVGITMNSEPVEISLEKAIPCALIANEIIANSLKHAFPSDWPGKAEISISVHEIQDNTIELVIKDNGIGLTPEAKCRTESLGLTLISILTSQINGEYGVESENGTKYTITFRSK